MYDCPQDSFFEKRMDACVTEEEKEVVRTEWIPFRNLEYGQRYSRALNQCIDARYRQKGFSINYVLSRGATISPHLDIKESDRLIYVNGQHTIIQEDSNYVLDEIGNVRELRVGGFHFSDCVQRFAEIAYFRGLSVLVDDELTELFGGFFENPEFNPEGYPSIDPRKRMRLEDFVQLFVNNRKERPWLYQWQGQQSF